MFKILLDPIYTNEPGRCASNAKMKKIAEHLLESYKDLYIYWLVPDWCDDMYDYPQDERIKFIPVPYSKDRMREYLRLSTDYERLVSFRGVLWDFDLLITNRVSVAPLIKALANKPSRIAYEWSKRVVLIEDMPLMDFKKHVALSHPKAQTLQTLVGYLCADRTYIPAYWEKRLIVQSARKYISPAMLRGLADSIVECSPVYVESLQFKKDEFIKSKFSEDNPFTIGFVGRMVHETKVDDIFKLMGKHWIYRGGNGVIRCVATTQSLGNGRVHPPPWVSVMHLKRTQFWEEIKTRVNVIVFLSEEEDYSMSLFEPLLLGTPAILAKNRWTVPSVGEDYPFFVSNIKEAYAYIKMFYEDYPKMYERFRVWSEKFLMPLMAGRNKEYLPHLLTRELDVITEFRKESLIDSNNIKRNEIVLLLKQYAEKNGNRLNIFEAIKELGSRKLLRHLDDKLDYDRSDKIKLTFSSDWNLFRLGLMCWGYIDASVEPGDMRLKE